VQGYGALARRFDRIKLLATVNLFFASHMVLFALLARVDSHIGLAFFLWVGLFSYTCIAQFWAFAADIYTEAQGKRLFAVLGVGSSVGSVAGSGVASWLVPLGPQALMMGASVCTVTCVVLLIWVARWARNAGGGAGAPASDRLEPEPVAKGASLHLLLTDKYLILIGAFTLAINCVSGLGDYILDRTLLQHVAVNDLSGSAATAFIGSFKADFFAWYNSVGVLVQLFVVSRVLTRVGVRGALLVLPVVAFAGFGAFLLAPSLALIRLVVIADRSLDYSLSNTTRHALFLVTSRVEKYVGKTTVDTVGARSGDLVSAAAVYVCALAGLHVAWLAGLCVLFACTSVAVAFGVGRENDRRRAKLVRATAT